MYHFVLSAVPNGTVLNFSVLSSRGWSGGAKVLGKLSMPGRPTTLDRSRARASCACSSCGWGFVCTFFLSSIISLERRRGRVVRAARLWCRKSPYRVSSRLGCAMRRLENSLCQPSRKWVPFSN